MNWFEELIISTHIPLKSVPKPYGVFHLIFTVLSLALIIAICYFIRNRGDRTFRSVMFSLGALLIISEIYKQIYYYFAVNGVGYNWDVFPFQLCSVPMYLSVVIGCMKKNGIRDTMCEYLACIGFLGGIMAYIEPSGILNEHYFTIIHSCIWHAILIFMGLYVLVTDNACNRLGDYKKAAVVLGGVVLTATAFNVIFRNKQDFNMCYISPFYRTPLAVFSTFDSILMDSLGQYIGRIISVIIYITALLLGGFMVYSIAYFTKKLVKKRAVS